AARRMWAKMMKEMGATEPKAQMLRFHTQTGGSTLTAQQPQNNIARVTLQAMSAVLGGTQSLHTNGFDEALSLPTQTAAGIALRTQQIIACESGAANTVDPLAGSYYVEELTNRLEEEAFSIIDTIDEMGGSVEAIESQWMQNEIAKSSYSAQKAIESQESIIVGMNKFQTNEKSEMNLLKVDDSIRSIQMDKILALKSERDAESVQSALLNLSETAKNGTNVMPTIIAAVENKATLGEVADTLRDVFGEYSGV
ncbi:MAG: methylmalonyl-CoA mutase family protein, partial [Bacteroidia bacterium]|nr:methylmalonyl-CoA mutase family protein [Bacteroidia bacterium]